MKALTENRIRKRHKQYPEDKEVHEIIENAEVDRGLFKRLVVVATQQLPFDKKGKKLK